MRRISANYAKHGMTLSRPVYDAQGFEVIESGTKLNDKLLRLLSIHSVAEIIIEDWRVADVPVQQLISPEHEGRAIQALRQIHLECQGTKFIDDALLEEAEDPILQMTRELFPEVIGEANAGGCASVKDYPYVQPVKVAGLSLLVGRRIGLGILELIGLGMAALFKDIGNIAFPQGLMDKSQPSEPELREIQKHPLYGANIVRQYERFEPEVSEAIFYHHERWDGTGYPEGLKKSDIPSFARIIGIADSYFELVSRRPNRQGLMPHEAVEYIMAYSGELFDPKLVEIFARQVPLYPTGVTVKLNTGEIGIVSDSNLGFIGRPTVRICFDEEGRALREPYDANLAYPENQGRLVVQVMEY